MSEPIYTKQHMEVMRDEWKKENAELKAENKNLSMGIKGVTSAKVNLNEAHKELGYLYDRQSAENAELKANWGELLLFAQEHNVGKSLYVEALDFIDKMAELERLGL